MQTLTHLGTFEALVENADATVAEIARKTRDLIEALHPEAVEVPRTKEKTATYGFGPKKMSEAYAFISVHKAHVNLGFFQGAHLDDPAALLEGTGAAIRHVKLKQAEDIDNPAIQDLLRQAMAERQAALSG